MEEWSTEQLHAAIDTQWDNNAAEVHAQVDRWLARGDSAVVYQNAELGHDDFGLLKITSYGSEQAMLEHSKYPDGPPQQMPDIGTAINWRYQLKAICKAPAVQ